MNYQFVKILLLIFLMSLCTHNTSFAQGENIFSDKKQFETIDPIDFDIDFFEKVILSQLNKQLKIRYNREELASDSILKMASNDHAKFMASYESEELRGAGKAKTTAKRVALYGGSNYAKEVVIKMSVRKGKE